MGIRTRVNSLWRHSLFFILLFIYLLSLTPFFFKLSDQGTFCGVTSTLCFGLRMTLPMSFKVRMESSPVLFCRLCETIPRAPLVAGTGYETRGAFHKWFSGGVPPSEMDYRGCTPPENYAASFSLKWGPPESVLSSHGDIPKPTKGPVTNDLGLSFVKQWKLHRSGMPPVVQNYEGVHPPESHRSVNFLWNAPQESLACWTRIIPLHQPSPVLLSICYTQ